MIDITAVRALDMHVHVEASSSTPPEDRACGHPFGCPSVDDIAQLYRSLGLACVVFSLDAGRTTDHVGVTSEEIADSAAAHSDVLIPFGSVDPLRPNAAQRMRRLVENYGVRGFKFHPGMQELFPDDRSLYPIYAELESLGVPAVFHTGQSGPGSRVRLKYCDPLRLDDVAVDFPGLKIIMAHPSFPWQDVALSIASRRPNVYIDLSGWSPKYFPPQLVVYANSIIPEKMLFGTDYPIITPERWLRDFAAAPFSDAVRPAILKDNAARLLGLGVPK